MARKYFGTDGVRGRVGAYPVTPEFSMKLGNALGQVLFDKKLPLLVVIGQDTRCSSDMLKSGFIAGITASGVSVINLNIIPTPVVAFMVKVLKSAAGVVLSASHNPYYDNGIKLFSHEGHKLPDDVEYQIERYIDEGFYYEPNGIFGEIFGHTDQVKSYIDHCISCFSNKISLPNKKIVIDCANGALFRISKEVFKCLDLDILEIASNPDGLNINKNCGAVHLDCLRKAVISKKAYMGIAFDGDGDRIILVDEAGCTFDGDDILLLLAKYSIKANGVVGTVMTNLAIEQEFLKMNVPFKRAKVGDRYVIEILLENNWVLGGESSGHIIDLRYNTTGDGLMAALQVLAVLSQLQQPLSTLLEIKKMPQLMINVPLDRKLDANDMSLLIEDVSFVEKSLGDNGRVILRPSGTEPVLRVMVEAKTETLTRKWTNYLVLKAKEKLNK